ncbi:MAG TPA: CusA/CzcA family heavy metal efflux RND transporter [Candidatus Krumholzibacteria bacterium]|nr:CusA/CzcA family heavy metal efflux RND transporter [Candidatus Krumholzibacteria bacterium]
MTTPSDQFDPTRSVAARIISWCVDNRFIVIIVTLFVTLGGILAMTRTPLDAIPDLSDVQVIIYSKWQGRDPQTIEDQVTYPLTTAMLSVPKVKVVRGYSFFGFSLVYVIFQDRTDLYWARSRVLEYLSQAQERIPEGVTTTLGPDATGVGWVYEYTLEDQSNRYNLGDLRAIQDWYVRYQLASVPGVAEVASIGGFVRQYQITVDPTLLQAYDIPLKRVVEAVKRSNNDVGGRLLEMSETEYMVRGRGYIGEIGDIEKIALAVDKDGTPVLLKDVATVQVGPDIRRGIAEKNGTGEAVGGIVVMRSGENALKVIHDVKNKINEISSGLPPGVTIHTAYDRSHLIVRSIHTLRHELIQQMLIVALVCVIFLWHARSALVAAFSLPLGILISFIVMRIIGINANIMSLGGIAIAIGAMVDAAVVLVENAHKHLERGHNPQGAERWQMIKLASMEVGPSLFFSLLIITASFLPVFALEQQAGRLFKPLAYTKTFAMAGAAVIAITITPILMGYFIRGKIHAENELAVSRFLVHTYTPVIRWALRHKTLIVTLCVAMLALTWFPYQKLGSEFMPPLNEGDILYMPTSIPGISETEAKRVLQTQDKLFMTFPEVKVAFGKIGRADTATDPAPLTMVETTVSLKDREDWPKRWIQEGFIRSQADHVLRELGRRGVLNSDKPFDRKQASSELENMVRRSVQDRVRMMYAQGKERAAVENAAVDAVHDELATRIQERLLTNGEVAPAHVNDLADQVHAAVAKACRFRSVPMHRLSMEELMYEDMDKEFQFVGLTNAWTMPIKTRIDMLATGIKTPIGIKVFGDDLATLERLAVEVEQTVKTVPGTLSAIAERVMGGNYIDFDINRSEVARYGLTVGDVQDAIETAVGGMNVTQTVEGRYRFPVNIRYPRELRDDPQKLSHVLVHAPTGAQVPMGQLADIRVTTGPPGIKSENGLLQAIVYVDLQKGQDVGGYVKRARAAVENQVKLPPGYYLSWSGQYQYMVEVNKRLRIVIPITLIIIFMLLYFNFRRLSETLIVMLSLPFALVGGVWFMYLLHYNVSVASGVGFIALSGLAAETGVVMLLFLDLAYEDEMKKSGRVMTPQRLHDAIIHGAVMRVRPKIMTVATTIMGLLPIMWTIGTGARPMKRMAAPMIGGLVSSTILTLIVIPVIYAIVKSKGMHASGGEPTAAGRNVTT